MEQNLGFSGSRDWWRSTKTFWMKRNAGWSCKSRLSSFLWAPPLYWWVNCSPPPRSWTGTAQNWHFPLSRFVRVHELCTCGFFFWCRNARVANTLCTGAPQRRSTKGNKDQFARFTMCRLLTSNEQHFFGWGQHILTLCTQYFLCVFHFPLNRFFVCRHELPDNAEGKSEFLSEKKQKTSKLQTLVEFVSFFSHPCWCQHEKYGICNCTNRSDCQASPNGDMLTTPGKEQPQNI